MTLFLRLDLAIAESQRLREQRRQVVVKTNVTLSNLVFQIEGINADIGATVDRVKVSDNLSAPRSSS
jgi:hypothetical protein